jgi:hypothetical protein
MIDKRYSKRELYDLGVITMDSPAGFPVKVYDKERTICDIVRDKPNMDLQVFVGALKGYVGRKDKDLSKLMEYAKALRVDSKIRDYMEVLL